MNPLGAEKAECYSDVTNAEAVKHVGKTIDTHTITLSGYCSVDYEGRASSHFDYSDVLVVTKPDGTLLIHQNEGRNPVNWQPPGCDFTVLQDEDELYIRAVRESENEKIEIHCAEVYSVTVHDISDTEEKQLFGTEDQMQSLIMDNPEVIEEGFRTLEREKSIETGAIDVFGRDKNGNPVILELKRRRAGPDAVDQLKRYMNSFGEELGEGVRGMLVAPSFTSTTISMLEDEGLEHCELEPPSRSDEEGGEATLDEFSGEND